MSSAGGPRAEGHSLDKLQGRLRAKHGQAGVIIWQTCDFVSMENLEAPRAGARWQKPCDPYQFFTYEAFFTPKRI